MNVAGDFAPTRHIGQQKESANDNIWQIVGLTPKSDLLSMLWREKAGLKKVSLIQIGKNLKAKENRLIIKNCYSETQRLKKNNANQS